MFRNFFQNLTKSQGGPHNQSVLKQLCSPYLLKSKGNAFEPSELVGCFKSDFIFTQPPFTKHEYLFNMLNLNYITSPLQLLYGYFIYSKVSIFLKNRRDGQSVDPSVIMSLLGQDFMLMSVALVGFLVNKKTHTFSTVGQVMKRRGGKLEELKTAEPMLKPEQREKVVNAMPILMFGPPVAYYAYSKLTKYSKDQL